VIGEELARKVLYENAIRFYRPKSAKNKVQQKSSSGRE
jgi:hypothetical protein